MWNLIYDKNEHIWETENRLTETESRLVIAKGNGGWLVDANYCFRMNKQQGPNV